MAYIVMAYIGMANISMAYIVMAYIVMICIRCDLYSYGLEDQVRELTAAQGAAIAAQRATAAELEAERQRNARLVEAGQRLEQQVRLACQSS